MDLAAMLDGAGILAAGMVIGRFWPARRRMPKPQKPVCGCTHDLAHHEPDGQGGGIACHAAVKGKITNWDDTGFPNGWDLGRCACKQYTGPRVLDPGYVARELTDG